MTELTYLDDSYMSRLSATILKVGSDTTGTYALLDRTIVYPQGGGQPSDQGCLRHEGNDYSIQHAQFVDGAVRHYIAPGTVLPPVGEIVEIEIDLVRRLRNARAHTAGHVLSHVIEDMFCTLQPVKGYHFPDGPHVEFLNDAGLTLSDHAAAIAAQLDDEVSKSARTEARYATFNEIAKIRPLLAPLIPKEKPTRIVQIGRHVPLPCGGTHVGELSELEQIRIVKIKNKKDRVKVSYEVGIAPKG